MMYVMTKQIKVLIVEDNDSIADLYNVYLESASFQIKRSVDGEQALVDIADFQPDILLLDAMMPKKGGFEVLEELRAKPETEHLPVIMFTALNQPKDQQRAEALGVKAYLVKSQVVISDIVDTINDVLGQQ